MEQATALLDAIKADDGPLVRQMLRDGASTNLRSDIGGGWGCLAVAASSACASALDVLLRHAPELDTDVQDSIGWDALSLAAAKGHIGCVSLLLGWGADPVPATKFWYKDAINAMVREAVAAGPASRLPARRWRQRRRLVLWRRVVELTS